MPALPPAPPTLLEPGGRVAAGLFAGRVVGEPVRVLPRRGRVRRWRYAAAAGDGVAIGAAVVDLGYVGAAFAWLLTDGELLTWEDRRVLGVGCSVGGTSASTASWGRGDDRVVLGDGGGLELEVEMGGRSVSATVDGTGDVPVSLVTRTAGGGWNVTEKEAGYRAHGTVTIDGAHIQLDGGGWRDWTVGRQDRRSAWMWAAGAGLTDHGRVGLNVSTGMNTYGAGENVVWWDGDPSRLEVTALERASDPQDTWQLRGPGWSLAFTPIATRAAAERLGPVRSDYVQPVGTFEGRLPGPAGEPVDVRGLVGVTEDHEARW